MSRRSLIPWGPLSGAIAVVQALPRTASSLASWKGRPSLQSGLLQAASQACTKAAFASSRVAPSPPVHSHFSAQPAPLPAGPSFLSAAHLSFYLRSPARALLLVGLCCSSSQEGPWHHEAPAHLRSRLPGPQEQQLCDSVYPNGHS